jgi:3-oxoadipate enol-lactonase
MIDNKPRGEAAKVPLIDADAWPGFGQHWVRRPLGDLSARVGGPPTGPAVLLNHSILTSSAIWRRQAALLAGQGFRVICLDTRGHGASAAPPAPYALDDLVADNVAVLDSLGIGRAHFIGVSLGGMTGLGLALRHPERLESLCVIAARADAPGPFAAAWDERIGVARTQGVAALAGPTAERWSGREFLDAHPELARALLACIGKTSVEGFVGCAQAIQRLDYLKEVGRITTPTTLVIGTRDEALLQPMRELARLIPGAALEEIAEAGHLPQIDKPAATEAALARHLQAVRSVA